MALVTIPGGFYLPPQMAHADGAPSFVTTSQIFNAEHKFAFIFQIPKTGTLDWFEVRQQTNGTTPNPGVTFAFQDLTAAGIPDGTTDQYRNITTGFGANTWLVPPGVMTNDGTDGGVKRSVTRGQWIACIIEFTPPFVEGNITLSLLSQVNAAAVSVPGNRFQVYRRSTVAGSWEAGTGNFPVLALKYDDGTYAEFPSIIIPASAITAVAFNNGSSPNHRGILFSLPTPVRVSGFYFSSNLPANLDVILYDAADTVLASISLVSTQGRTTAYLYTTAIFSTIVNLTKDVNYRLIIKPTTISNITLLEVYANSAALRAAFPMGTYRQLTHGSPGSWTNVNTSVGADMGLIIDAIDDGSGGGGGGGEHSSVF